MVAAALVDGPSFNEPDGGYERGVEDGDREHEQRDDQRRDRRLATFQLVARPSAASVSPITWLPESPMKTAAGFRGRKL